MGEIRRRNIALCFSITALVTSLSGVIITSVSATSKALSQSDTINVSEILGDARYDVGEPSGSYIMSEEEFEEFKAEDSEVVTFATYEDYVGSTSASFVESTAGFSQESIVTEYNPNITATGANAKLYNYSDKYFQVYFGDKRISPIFPLAIANVETGGRANHDITWSSLFPSAIADISLIDTFDVTTVVSDDKLYKALSSDYSTRDRGALQMSPTYGAGSQATNKHMSGTEKSKLSKVNTSKYSAWCAGASDCAGDRFYIPDELLRMKVAMDYNVGQIVANGYAPVDINHLLAMLAVGHNSGSGVFAQHNSSNSVGNWVSAKKCYEWCEMCTGAEVISLMYEYYKQTNAITMSRDTATKLIAKCYPNISSSTYCRSQANFYYPVCFMYTYIVLCDLYTK